MYEFIMQSLNFQFLHERWPLMAALGGFAEQYVHNDPSSALVKMRTLVESMVQEIFQAVGLKLPAVFNLNDCLRSAEFGEVVPSSVRLKMDAIRDHGNKAAHGENISQRTALYLLEESYNLASWFYVTYARATLSACGKYKEPPVGGVSGETKARLKEEKRRALERLAEQEAQLADMMAEMESLREKAALAERAFYAEPGTLACIAMESEELEMPMFSRKAPEPNYYAKAGQAAADELKFSEATTRKWLIDSQLVAAGWKVGHNGAPTDEVTQEEEVPHQPTKTGLGYIDYVLWDDNGKPLAVIEAKKTAESARSRPARLRQLSDFK